MVVPVREPVPLAKTTFLVAVDIVVIPYPAPTKRRAVENPPSSTGDQVIASPLFQSVCNVFGEVAPATHNP